MSLITHGINPVADEVVREIMAGRVPESWDVIALAQECVRLTLAAPAPAPPNA